MSAHRLVFVDALDLGHWMAGSADSKRSAVAAAKREIKSRGADLMVDHAHIVRDEWQVVTRSRPRSGTRVAPRGARVDYRPSAEALTGLDGLATAAGLSRNATLDRLVLDAVGTNPSPK